MKLSLPSLCLALGLVLGAHDAIGEPASRSAAPLAPPAAGSGVRVAITGPVDLAYKLGDTDTLERTAYEAFGQLASKGLLDEVLQVDTPYEFMARLANVARAALAKGRRIDHLIINGHGSGVEAGFSLGQVAFLPRHVDRDGIKQDLLRSQAQLWAAKARWLSLSHASLADPGRLAALRQDIDQLEPKIARLGKYLVDMETVSMAMAPGAQILYAVCFTARNRTNLSFATDLGSILLGKGGGAIVASKTGVAPVRRRVSYLESWLGVPGGTDFQTEKKRMDWMRNGSSDTATINWWAENWVVAPIPPSPAFATPLLVQFTPDVREVGAGSTQVLEPKTLTLPAAERLTSRWEGPCQDPTASVCRATLMATSEGLLVVSVNVEDPLGHKGEGRVFLWKKGEDAPPPASTGGRGGSRPSGFWQYVEPKSQERPPSPDPAVRRSGFVVSEGSITGQETTMTRDEGPAVWGGACSWTWWQGVRGLDVLRPGDQVEASMTATDQSEPEKVSGWHHGSTGVSGNVRFDRPYMPPGTVHRAAVDIVGVQAGWKKSDTAKGKATVPSGPGDPEWGGKMSPVANCGFRRFERVYRWETGVPPASTAPPGVEKLSGTWAGRWTNSLGERGADSLIVTEDAEGGLSGTWSGNIPVTGRRTGGSTFEMSGRTATREYRITASLSGGTLALDYTVRRLDAAGSYSGRSTFNRR
jgi:hypothetical protein